MSNKLEQYYIDYAETVRSEIHALLTDRAVSANIALFSNKIFQLRTYAEKLEVSPKFNSLVKETCATFSKSGHGKSISSWNNAVKNVLRRSNFYSNICESGQLDLAAGFEKYYETFKRTESHILYLAPIEFVYFARDVMDFGRFQIRRFKEDELGSVLGNSVNEIFYPWAAVDLSQFRDYWYICLRETVQAPKIGISHMPWSEIGRVGFRYTSLPMPLEAVVKQLALYDWQADYWRRDHRDQKKEEDMEEGWQGFNVPFVFRVHDNLYGTPASPLSLSKLRKEPLFDTQTGEEIGERPEIHIHFNEEETEYFKAYISRLGEFLSKLNFEKNEWQFFEIAMGTFVKAFFAEDLDQLLWHITSLEALFGEKGEGLTERLARRIAAVLGKNKNAKKSLKQSFKRLYAFRSDLVHGNRFEKEVYWGHLREARNFARRTLIWYLNLLSTIQDGISKHQSVLKFPKREVILTLLDMNEEQRAQLEPLVQILPTGFPHKEEWIL